jgi:hypothetical protein
VQLFAFGAVHGSTPDIGKRVIFEPSTVGG